LFTEMDVCEREYVNLVPPNLGYIHRLAKPLYRIEQSLSWLPIGAQYRISMRKTSQ
jgi:hypothetical protein